ncbi:Poly(ADP-ribose) glycohydrolase ARH3 [Camponotus floridanus]|uniref:ADP-ribosylhydrolase ARH3 n=1 Tax=Camponotus floridanus TaxID=104421 RepID=E2AR96_CAMFO|nr:Poly(ADP-ribose) glycohydrolase ARH3 [Camponotus floridanus]
MAEADGREGDVSAYVCRSHGRKVRQRKTFSVLAVNFGTQPEPEHKDDVTVSDKVVCMDLELLKSKFRGTMLGVLVGDILGKPYEGETIISDRKKIDLQRKLDNLEESKSRESVMGFTDDSAMTYSVAESLIEKRDLDIIDVAKRFVENFFQEHYRGYGNGCKLVSNMVLAFI